MRAFVPSCNHQFVNNKFYDLKNNKDHDSDFHDWLFSTCKIRKL